MPGTLRMYDPANEGLQKQADEERKARIALIDGWWDWREGRHPDVLRTYPGERDDNVKMNLVGQMVDDVADFVGLPALAIAGDKDVSSTQNSALEAFLQASLWEELAGDLVESALVTGHAFVRLVEPENGGALSVANPPAMALLDPRHVTVFWDMERFGTRKTPLWYQLAWVAGDVTKRQDIVPAALLPTSGKGARLVDRVIGDRPGEGWAIIEWVKEREGEWEPTAADVFPWDFAPIVDAKAARRPHAYYGRSFIDGLDHLNDHVNYVMSNTGKILRYHAHPKTVLIDATLEDAMTGPDELIEIRASGTNPPQLFNVEMQSDLESSLDYQSRLRAAMFAAGRVVDPLSVHDKVGQLTNFGLRTLYKSMIDMVEAYRGRVGALYEIACQRGLAMMGVPIDPPLVTWDDPLPLNRVEDLQAAQMEHALGTVSRQTLASDLGRDWEREEDRIQEEAARAGEGVARQLELFGEMGMMT